jgi:type VI secretion system secreted protein VgrG
MSGERDVMDGLASAASVFGQLADVRYEVEVSGAEGRWAIRSIDLHETLNDPFEVTIEALVVGAHPETSDLLGRDCALSMERASHVRSIKGIVRKARIHERFDGVHVRLVVVPALWYLGHNRDSRIYQNKTHPQIIEELYQRRLGGRSRQIRNDLTRTYPTLEYVTQYQESDLAFLSRLCEHSGIFFFFDHEEGDHEVLVLADATSGLAAVHDAAVPFWENAEQAPDGEAVVAAAHVERVRTTDVVVAEYDWTRPSSAVRAEQTGRGDHEPALEDYDHVDAVALYDYGGRAYGSNDASTQAQMRAERLVLDRQTWTMRSTVVAAQPGKLLELTGCPNGALDGRRYLIVSLNGSGEATAGARGGYENSFECVPVDLPYWPPRRAPRPVVPGPETAIVVGPSGEEIHTDEHGRVKVQFHWDRQGQRNEQSSCWLRVQQSWSGPSWGTWFLPRIGMEVVVQFVRGNPDMPFVSGCLYNGDNHTPYPLPDEKTKSTIKTNSSPGGGGFNELRFEDKAGSEEVFLHAQKNLVERVLNDHTTHVSNDHRNTVDGNDSEKVGKDQELVVIGNRTHTVEKDETVTITQNRSTEVGIDDTQHVIGSRFTTIDTNETHDVFGTREGHVIGAQTWTIDGGSTLTITGGQNQTIASGGWRTSTTGNSDHSVTLQYVLHANQDISMTTDMGATIIATGPMTLAGQSITLRSDTEVVVTAPQGMRYTTPASETSVASQLYSTVSDFFETIKGKFGMYTMAVTLYGMKVDIGGVKIDHYATKFDNKDLKLGIETIHLAMSATARLQKAAVTLID